MKKFVKEQLYEDDTMNSQIPVTDPVVAQKLANGQAALAREDIKLQALKDKMIPINKKKAQIQKAMIKAQEENARNMNQQAKEQAKQQSQIKAAQDAQAEVQAANPTQTPVMPTTESILQSDLDRIEILEDKIVVMMQKEKPDYKKINELIESVESSMYESKEEPFLEGSEVYYVKPSYGVHKVLLYDEDKKEYLIELPADNVFPRYEFWTPEWRVIPIHESLITKENFYDLSEAYTEFEDPEKKTEDDIDDEYLFYVKIFDDEDWFIAKIFKVNPTEDWFGIIKAGENDSFDKISYDPEFDEDAIVEFLKDTYDKVEIIDQAEYDDYAEDAPNELDEEGGVTGMHL